MLSPNGNYMYFFSVSNNTSIYYFSDVPVQLCAGRWYQFTLTYSPTNVALYTNGLLAATAVGRPSAGDIILNDVGNGVYNYPAPDWRALGFRLGNDYYNAQQVNAEYDELETFNYPLSARDVAHDFPNFNGTTSNVIIDSDYDGRSDVLEDWVDGTDKNDPGSVVPTRLGYWRFNDPTNTGEMGQSPLLVAAASQAPSWSGQALAISSTSTSRLLYREFETNGWHNFNCRLGAVRFWFKPNWSTGAGPSGTAPLLAMGDDVSNWLLYIRGSGQQVGFSLKTPIVNTNFFYAPYTFSAGHWYQIVLNYAPASVALYINGSLQVTQPIANWDWPNSTARAKGLGIGNWPDGGAPVDGQFEELETFNYNLTTAEIAASFASVKSVDIDLNGVADLLEELILPTNAPFAGVPFPVTGVFEAEQFDMGGPDVGYHTLDAANATTNYRSSRLWITNCNDFGGGWSVDNLRAGEDLRYTIDVRVGQTYAVETRFAGIGTNGSFSLDFYTNGVLYASTTNNLVVTTTDWANVTFKNLTLAAGTNLMKITMRTNGLVNGVDSGYVGRLNYISILPSWNEGVTNIGRTNDLAGLLTPNSADWITASNNSVAIQSALDDLTNLPPTQGGVVLLPAGRYYVASREVTAETSDETHNTAIFIYRNHVQIQGAGRTNTTLVAHSRAVSMFYIGRSDPVTPVAITNVVISGVGLEGSPHWVYDAAAVDQRRWEDGGFNPNPTSGTYHSTGCPIVARGIASPLGFVENVLIDQCLLKNGSCDAITLVGHLRNFLLRSSDVLFWADGTNGSFSGRITVSTPTTLSNQVWNVGVFARNGGPNLNIGAIGCTFNGNPGVSNLNQLPAADGILWFQSWGGNWFAARNEITNYGLEAIAWNGGPGAAVQNTFFTRLSTWSTCALMNPVYGTGGPTPESKDLSFALVGNQVTGGRHAVFGVFMNPGVQTPISRLLVGGNTVDLSPPLPINSDWPGSPVTVRLADRLNVTGNTLIQSGSGVIVQVAGTNAIVLGNDFSAAATRNIDALSAPGQTVSWAVARNKLGSGTSFHFRAQMPDGQRFFLLRNEYLDATGSPTPLFTEPLALPVHVQ